MTVVETLEVAPERVLRFREALPAELHGGPGEDIATGNTLPTLALKRKRIDEEHRHSATFEKSLVPNLVGSPSSLIEDQVPVPLSALQATYRVAPGDASQNTSLQLSAWPFSQRGSLGVVSSPSTDDGTLSFFLRQQQAVPCLQEPTPESIYPSSITSAQAMPPNNPNYTNCAIPPPYLDTCQQAYQQMQQNLITDNGPPYWNHIPAAPGFLPPFQPQTHLFDHPLPQSHPAWLFSNLPPPTTPNDLTTNANIPSLAAPVEGGRYMSKTIEHFADILVDLIQLHTATAVSAGWASCQSPTKVDQTVQTDIAEVETTEADTQPA